MTVPLQRRIVGPGKTRELPATHPATKHLEPYARNNDPRATAKWCRANPGGYADDDMGAARNRRGQWVPYFAHWGTARKNGFHFLQVGAVRRRLTDRELDQQLHSWPLRKVLRLRTKRVGGFRPGEYRRMLRTHARHGVTMMAEAKVGQPGLQTPGPYLLLAAYADQIGASVGVMTLPMSGWRERLRAAKAGGLQTAVIGGRGDWSRELHQLGGVKPPEMDRAWLPGWAGLR